MSSRVGVKGTRHDRIIIIHRVTASLEILLRPRIFAIEFAAITTLAKQESAALEAVGWTTWVEWNS